MRVNIHELGSGPEKTSNKAIFKSSDFIKMRDWCKSFVSFTILSLAVIAPVKFFSSSLVPELSFCYVFFQ